MPHFLCVPCPVPVVAVRTQPRGNAMLVGVGGSGKQSLTRFAAHISGCKVFQIELSRVYGAAEFRADLVRLYRIAGVDNEPVVFLFSDTQMLQESFLEDVNNMLNSGALCGSIRVWCVSAFGCGAATLKHVCAHAEPNLFEHQCVCIC